MVSRRMIPEISAAWLCGIAECRQDRATNVTFLDARFGNRRPAALSHFARDRKTCG
jgi:hypothetical protein